MIGAEPAAVRAEPSAPATWAAIARWAVVVFVALAIALGIAMRAWYLAHDPINSDEALIGIRARQILGGHLYAFLPGLHYEAVGPYLVAATFGIFGPSSLALNVPVVLCDAVSCVLVWRVGLRLSGRADVAALCAAAMWVAPQSALWNSTMEYGFRGVTMACGAGMMLLALRLGQGSSRWWDAPLLGAVFGVGWWSSPEIVYFAIPSALWTAAWLWRARSEPSGVVRVLERGVAGLVGFGVGALPWLWDNLTSGFPSLSVTKADLPAVVPSYAARLGDFFTGALPTVLDLRVPRTGAWTVPAALGITGTVVLGAVIGVAALWQLWRHRIGAPVALAVLAYPFILAAEPVSWDWQSARYTNFLVPLLALLAAVTLGDAARAGRAAQRASGEGTRSRWRARMQDAHVARLVVAGALAAGLLATTMAAFVDLTAVNVLSGSRLGASPDAPAQQLVAGLERAGVQGGYANYWVAYKLDFLAGGKLQIADTPASPNRLPEVEAAARALPASRQAWIFLAPTPTARTEYADTAVIRGPSGMPQSRFLSDAGDRGAKCRVLHVAGAEAVICHPAVFPAELGLRYPPSRE